MNINELYRQKKSLYDQMRSMTDRVKNENRIMTESELKEFHSLDTKYSQVQDSLDAELRLERIAAGEAEPLDDDSPRDKGEVWKSTRGPAINVIDSKSPYTGNRGGLTLGGFMRSMITGPQNDAERRALAEGTGSAGGYTVPEALSGTIIDRLRAKTRVIQAGARIVPLTTDSNKFAKLLTDPSASWKAENSELSPSDPTFDVVEFTPFTLRCMVLASRELVQDSVNIETALEMALTKALAEKIDAAALSGSGSGEPKGIKNYTGIAIEYTMGVNGGYFTDYEHILTTIGYLLTANSDMPTAMICHPRTAVELANLQATDDQPLRKPQLIESIPILDTTSVGITDSQGDKTFASRLYIGNFRDLVIGIRSDIQIEVLRERYAEFYEFAFLAHARIDIKPWHEASFAVIKGIIPPYAIT